MLIIKSFGKFLLNKIPVLAYDESVAVLIRLDGIGDYVLFRNFIPYIKQAEILRGRKLILIGNQDWQTLAETFDSSYFDGFIWVNKKRFETNDYGYKLKLFWQLRRLKAMWLINPIHSRSLFSETIVAFIKAKINIAASGDEVNLGAVAKTQSDAGYHQLIPSLSTDTFEFYRNRAFAAVFSNQKIHLAKPFFGGINHEPKSIIGIFPGAGEPQRIWSAENFAHLIQIIQTSNPSMTFEIYGSSTDKAKEAKIRELIAPTTQITAYCAQLSLPELIERLTACRLIISNETSAVHFAAALDIPCVCISNGERFGRFSPYPLSISSKIHTIFPNDSFYAPEKQELLKEQFRLYSPLNINTISVEQVYRFVQAHL
jgi:ADP-heptose:LPS heptosyltransferase